MKYKKFLGAFASIIVLIVSCGEESTGPSELEEGWSETTVGGITLQWIVEDTLLRVKVNAPTTGWVGVGFDPSNCMLEANFIIGFVSVESPYTSFRDDYGTGQFTHESDLVLGGTDDVEFISAGEMQAPGWWTEIEFRIPLDSGDEYDKPLIEGNTYTVILAYGPDGADDFTTQHSVAVSTSIEI